MNVNENIPLVSVCMITYNHEKFIERAISGVLMQEGNFRLELIIANDASPDNTEAIVKDFQKNHPLSKSIKYYFQVKNVGVKENFNFALKQCGGEYIALCEGDDFWNDPCKLQKQVDFLESNREYIACGHNRYVYNEETKTYKKQELRVLKTQCTVFRNQYIRNPIFQKYFVRVLNMDTFLFNYLTQFGKLEILPFFGATYRISDTGIFSTKVREYREEQIFQSLNITLKMFEEMGLTTTRIHNSIANTYKVSSHSDISAENFKDARINFSRYLSYKLSHGVKLSDISEIFLSSARYASLYTIGMIKRKWK